MIFLKDSEQKPKYTKTGKVSRKLPPEHHLISCLGKHKYLYIYFLRTDFIQVSRCGFTLLKSREYFEFH